MNLEETTLSEISPPKTVLLFHLHNVPRVVKLTETEGRILIIIRGRGRGNEKLIFVGTEFQSRQMESLLETGYTMTYTHNTIELCTKRWLRQ